MDITSKINSLKYLEEGLNAASLRHGVISNNIANAETPGFKKSVVLFEEALKEALKRNNNLLKRTNDKHFPGTQQIPGPKIVSLDNTTMRNDLNNVDIDYEMTMLAKNTLMFQALSEQISRKFSSLKTVISGGR
ncbi:MAG: flagellar basal body rod protein FlgB [Bacillota bacterium]|nr:flagellar basal body rod protein FlgB [Bacillota bacterium]